MGTQLDAAVLMHRPLEIVLPNTEIIHLLFWPHLNQIQEPWSCFESDAILRTDGLTQATFLTQVIHKYIHFDTAGQVTNISYTSAFQSTHLQWKWFLGKVFSSATWVNVLCVCRYTFVEQDVIQSQFHWSFYLIKGAIDLSSSLSEPHVHMLSVLWTRHATATSVAVNTQSYLLSPWAPRRQPAKSLSRSAWPDLLTCSLTLS